MGSRLESKSNEVRKRIQSHQFDDEEGEEYKASHFGGFSDYFRRKKIKLQNLDAEIRSQSTDKPHIFRGIVAHVNGYTQPSLNDLHHMIVSHGGGFIQYLDGKTMVTHIIASSLTPKKAVEFKQYRIVKPAWIVDSVAAGKLLPWDSYRVIDEGVGQKILRFENGKVSTQVNDQAKGYRDQTETSWYTSQLAKSKLSTDPSAAAPSSPYANSKSLGTLEFESRSNESPAAETAARDLEKNNPEHNKTVESSVDEPPDQALPAESEFQKESSESHIQIAEESPRPRTLLNPHIPLDLDALDDDDDDDDHADSLDELEETNREGQPSLAQSPSGRTYQDLVRADEEGRELTAEEHNSILLSDPRIRKSSVLNPEFLEQYYRESRLHHLSTWKADLKSQLQALTAEKSASQKARQKRQPGGRRYILHVDFDSFFVAVSLKAHPHWVDKPCVVAHGSGSGSEIASCNYPARDFGVKNGMWMRRALDLCKDLKVLPYDFPAYEAASKSFYDAILASGGVVQSVSIDEALVDITTLCLPAGGTDGVGIREGSIWREEAKAEEVAQGIRNQVKAETGCAVSVGIGGNILLAKVALRKAKPAGQHQIKPDQVLDFIGELQVQDLPGVAYSIGGKLEEIGIKYVKDIREFTRERLTSVLGPKTGEKIWNYARGIDTTEVGDQVVRKSVSAEVNWGVRFETSEQAEEFIENLCGELHRRLAKEKVKGRHLTFKIMRRAADAPRDPPKHLGHGKCDTYNKSVVLGVATNARDVIAKEALSILRGFGFSPGELRGLGVQMTKLEPIKPNPAAQNIDGSQRRLQFMAAPTTSKDTATKEEKDDPIEEDPKTPRKSNLGAGTVAVPQPRVSVFQNSDSPSRKPLNTMGTQFVLPTQVDPKVLAELPADIRSRLSKANKGELSTSVQGLAASESDSNSFKLAATTVQSFSALPNQSQLDPEILASLPEDVRDEILAEYNNSNLHNSPSKIRAGQSVLPQSPRKTRTLQTSRKSAARGRPRGTGGSFLSRLKGSSSRNDTPTLTQSNFVASASSHGKGRKAADGEDAGMAAFTDSEISAEFLAALPDDIRRELVDNQRRQQLKRTANLEVSRRRNDPHRRNLKGGDTAPSGQRTIKLEPRPSKPSFTMRKLSKADDLRDAISAWVDEFDEEGPYREDVEALGRYLKAVVLEEGDMSKAVGVVKWFDWVLDSREAASSGEKATARWKRALESARASVADAVQERGLGAVDF